MMKSVFSTVINGISNLGAYIPSQGSYRVKHNKQILDPIICVLKVALLSGKQVGTKLSIHDGKISYHKPMYIVQGAIRTANRDRHTDLHNLCEPIENMLKMYDTKDPVIRGILLHTINGLKQLKETYKDLTIVSTNPDKELEESSLVLHSLNLYIKTITDKLNEKEIEQPPQQLELENKNEENAGEKEHFLKKIWTKKEINMMFEMFETITEDNKDFLIEAIDTFLCGKEQIACETINNYISHLKIY